MFSWYQKRGILLWVTNSAGFTRTRGFQQNPVSAKIRLVQDKLAELVTPVSLITFYICISHNFAQLNHQKYLLSCLEYTGVYGKLKNQFLSLGDLELRSSKLSLR